MADKVRRPLRAKIWDSLVTGVSASGPLANMPVTRLTRYRHNNITGTRFRCTKSVPVTSIYCTLRHRCLDRGQNVCGNVKVEESARYFFFVTVIKNSIPQLNIFVSILPSSGARTLAKEDQLPEY